MRVGKNSVIPAGMPESSATDGNPNAMSKAKRIDLGHQETSWSPDVPPWWSSPSQNDPVGPSQDVDQIELDL